jgi:hypothetical protein
MLTYLSWCSYAAENMRSLTSGLYHIVACCALSQKETQPVDFMPSSASVAMILSGPTGLQWLRQQSHVCFCSLVLLC